MARNSRVALVSLLAAAFFALATLTAMAEVVGVAPNVLTRVKRIEIGETSGTAFLLDVDGRQYLVTAKHVVAALQAPRSTIKVCSERDDCINTDVRVWRCEDPIDIAVLVPPRQQAGALPLEPDSSGMTLGQDVFFVGFPYADPTLTTTSEAGGMIGFVRKGVFSAQEIKPAYTRYYLDARNNSGFSGAPVVYLARGVSGSEFRVAAVVSGYRSYLNSVMRLEPINKERIRPEDWALNRIIEKPDGSYGKLVPTDQIVSENTGIVVAYSIGHALDLIRNVIARSNN